MSFDWQLLIDPSSWGFSQIFLLLDLIGFCIGLVALIIASLTITQARQRFLVLAAGTALGSMGCALMIVVSSDIGAISLALQASLLFLLLTTVFTFVFILDYTGNRFFKSLTLILTLFAVVAAVFILSYPLQTLFLKNILADNSSLHYVAYAPGILFQPFLAVCILFDILAAIVYIRYFVSRRLKVPQLALFLIIFLLPIIGIAPLFVDIIPGHWIPAFFFTNLMLFVLSIYIAKAPILQRQISENPEVAREVMNNAATSANAEAEKVQTPSQSEPEAADTNTAKLINASPFICLLFDKDGNILDNNSAALRFFGYQSKDELKDALPALLDTGLAGGVFRRHLVKTLELGKNEFQSEFTVNSRHVYLNFFMKSLYLGNDPSVAVYMIIPSAQESMLDTLIDLAPISLDLVDINLAPSISNQRLLYLLGFKSKAQYLKYHWSAFPPQQPDGQDTIDLLFAKVKEVLVGGYVWFPLELQNIADGSRLDIQMHLIYLRRGEEDLIFRFFSDTASGERYAEFYAYLLPLLRGGVA